MATALYRQCRALFDSLPKRQAGTYGKGDTVLGRRIEASVGGIPAMVLYADRDPEQEVIALLLEGSDTSVPQQGGEARIYVYATPRERGKTTLGGSEAEAWHLLSSITRRRDTSSR